MNRMPSVALLLLAAIVAKPTLAVTFDFAHIGNAGNTPDPQTGFGAVSYSYAISKTEVTNAQYVEFLNAVAATDDFGGTDPTLYNASMGSSNRGGINRSGMPGSFTYSSKANFGDKPVNFVSFFDAMRFTNWLHNGQGAGDTETGAYTIGGGTNEVRSADARYWIPSEDEWYKAAYHQPATNGGDADDYWLYPTATNTRPMIATANGVGDISNSASANVANYSIGADWNAANGNVTTVGSAGPLSASYYGTFDQGGNVFEWNEAARSFDRGMRGGSWNNEAHIFSGFLRAVDRSSGRPTIEHSAVGFRVATIPEPSTMRMGATVAVGMWFRRRV